MPSQLNNEASFHYDPSDTETYEEWFQRQVETGLREADDPNTVWVTNEQVFKELDERLQQWRTQTEQRKAS